MLLSLPALQTGVYFIIWAQCDFNRQFCTFFCMFVDPIFFLGGPVEFSASHYPFPKMISACITPLLHRQKHTFVQFKIDVHWRTQVIYGQDILPPKGFDWQIKKKYVGYPRITPPISSIPQYLNSASKHQTKLAFFFLQSRFLYISVLKLVSIYSYLEHLFLSTALECHKQTPLHWTLWC